MLRREIKARLPEARVYEDKDVMSEDALIDFLKAQG